MKFVKMQGCGNDFIIFESSDFVTEDLTAWSERVCDRRYGIGADGVIIIRDSDRADKKIEIYNSDGTRAKMCGNGIRCVGRILYDHGMNRKHKISIETDAGIRDLRLAEDNMISVDMGEPLLETKGIPVMGEKNIMVNERIEVCNTQYKFTAVSMGNPHAVLFVEDTDKINIERIGISLEYHPIFPERTNVEFVKVTDRQNLEMRVWERGAGETPACGTGACAAVVAAVLNNLTDDTVKVKLKGGNLFVRWNRKVNRVYMKGPAVKVFDGEI